MKSHFLLKLCFAATWLFCVVNANQMSFCQSNLTTRFTAIKSFTFERASSYEEPGLETFFSEAKLNLVDRFEPLMLYGHHELYELLVAHGQPRLSTGNPDRYSAHKWHEFVQMPSNDVPKDEIESLYVLAKKDSTSSGYETAKFGATNPRGLYQVFITTRRQEFLWSRKRGFIFSHESRRYPSFTMALNATNSGYLINEDIYGQTKDYAFYSFHYEASEQIDDYQIRELFDRTIHRLNVPERRKATAKYFYAELTDSPNMIQFTPRNLRSHYNPSRALFHSRPLGFIRNGRLYLLDLATRCVYNLSHQDIGDLTARYNAGEWFRVSRVNHPLEWFVGCYTESEKVRRVEEAEVLRRCGRTVMGGEPEPESGSSTPDLGPSLETLENPKEGPQESLTPNATPPSNPNNDEIEASTSKPNTLQIWFWVLLALFLLLIVCIFGVILYLSIAKPNAKLRKLLKNVFKRGPPAKSGRRFKSSNSLVSSKSRFPTSTTTAGSSGSSKIKIGIKSKCKTFDAR